MNKNKKTVGLITIHNIINFGSAATDLCFIVCYRTIRI